MELVRHGIYTNKKNGRRYELIDYDDTEIVLMSMDGEQTVIAYSTFKRWFGSGQPNEEKYESLPSIKYPENLSGNIPKSDNGYLLEGIMIGVLKDLSDGDYVLDKKTQTWTTAYYKGTRAFMYKASKYGLAFRANEKALSPVAKKGIQKVYKSANESFRAVFKFYNTANAPFLKLLVTDSCYYAEKRIAKRG